MKCLYDVPLEAESRKLYLGPSLLRGPFQKKWLFEFGEMRKKHKTKVHAFFLTTKKWVANLSHFFYFNHCFVFYVKSICHCLQLGITTFTILSILINTSF